MRGVNPYEVPPALELLTSLVDNVAIPYRIGFLQGLPHVHWLVFEVLFHVLIEEADHVVADSIVYEFLVVLRRLVAVEAGAAHFGGEVDRYAPEC